MIIGLNGSIFTPVTLTSINARNHPLITRQPSRLNWNKNGNRLLKHRIYYVKGHKRQCTNKVEIKSWDLYQSYTMKKLWFGKGKCWMMVLFGSECGTSLLEHSSWDMRCISRLEKRPFGTSGKEACIQLPFINWGMFPIFTTTNCHPLRRTHSVYGQFSFIFLYGL